MSEQLTRPEVVDFHELSTPIDFGGVEISFEFDGPTSKLESNVFPYPERSAQPETAEATAVESQEPLNIESDVKDVIEVLLASRAASDSRLAVSELERMIAEAARHYQQKEAELSDRIADFESKNQKIIQESSSRKQRKAEYEQATGDRSQSLKEIMTRREVLQSKLLIMRNSVQEIEALEAELMAESINSAATDILQPEQNQGTEVIDSLLTVFETRQSNLEKVLATEQVILDSYKSDCLDNDRRDTRQISINDTAISDSERSKAHELMTYEHLTAQCQEKITDVKDNYTPRFDDLRQKIVESVRSALVQKSKVEAQSNEVESLEEIAEKVLKKETELREDIPRLKDELEAAIRTLKASYDHMVKDWTELSQEEQYRFSDGYTGGPVEVQPHQDEKCIRAQDNYDRALQQLKDAEEFKKATYISIGAENSKLSLMQEAYADYMDNYVHPLYEEMTMLHKSLRGDLAKVGVIIKDLSFDEQVEQDEDPDDTANLQSVVSSDHVNSVKKSIINQAG